MQEVGCSANDLEHFDVDTEPWHNVDGLGVVLDLLRLYYGSVKTLLKLDDIRVVFISTWIKGP